MSESVVEFIDRKNGPTAMAKVVTGHTAGAISVWRARNKLPRHAWPDILQAYADITLEDLFAMEGVAAPPARSRKAKQAPEGVPA